MPTEVKHSGAWRTLTGVEAKHSGSWRTIKTIEAKSGGAWRTVYSGDTLALPASISSSGFDLSSPYDARAAVKVDTNGYMYRLVTNAWSQVSGADYWINNKSATMSDYQCQLVRISGQSTANLYGLNLSQWYTLSTDRAWGINKTTAGNIDFSGTLYIREIANTSNQVTCGVTFYADAGTL